MRKTEENWLVDLWMLSLKIYTPIISMSNEDPGDLVVLF